jgi:hypothetical protein
LGCCPLTANTAYLEDMTVEGRFRLGVELGSMPFAYFVAVEETVRETLSQGIHGWQVTDRMVTMTHSGFSPPPSTAGDFRDLTSLILMDALQQAGTSADPRPGCPGMRLRPLSADPRHPAGPPALGPQSPQP